MDVLIRKLQLVLREEGEAYDVACPAKTPCQTVFSKLAEADMLRQREILLLSRFPSSTNGPPYF